MKNYRADTDTLVNAVDGVVDYIDAEIKKIEDDERHHYPPALIQVNAPLALIQVQLQARRDALEEVLEKIETYFP